MNMSESIGERLEIKRLIFNEASVPLLELWVMNAYQLPMWISNGLVAHFW